MSTLDKILEQAAAQGSLESSGQFTLELHSAREKLAEFQLKHPSYYLQRLLQGLIGFGPEAVKISITKKYIQFEMVPAPSGIMKELKQALARGLESQDSLQILAAGLNSSFSADIQSVDIASRDGGMLETLRIEESVSEGECVSLTDLSVLAIRLNRKQAPSLWRRFMGPKSMAMEHQVLSQAFTYSAAPIHLGGRALQDPRLGSSRGTKNTVFGEPDFHLVERFVFDSELSAGASLAYEPRKSRRASVEWEEREGRDFRPNRNSSFNPLVQADHRDAHNCFYWSRVGQGEHCKAMLALRYELRGEARIGFVNHGLLCEVVSLDLGCPGVTGYCSAHGLKTDIGGLKLVRDRHFEERVEELRAHVLGMAQDFDRAWKYSRMPLANEEFNRHFSPLTILNLDY